MATLNGELTQEEINHILTRKEQLIKDNLIITDTDVEDLHKYEIIDVDQKSELLALKDEKSRVKYILELTKDRDQEFYEKFYKAIEKANRWISDELQAEMIASIGKELEEYIEHEAGMIVHREFGTSKRLSETEKADFKKLLAVRTQYGMNVWRKQLDRVKEDLRKEKLAGKERDTYAKELADKIEQFIAKFKDSITVPDSQCKIQSLAQLFQTNDSRPQVERLSQCFSTLTDMTSKSFLEMENYFEERDRALKILRLRDPNIQLDLEMSAALDRAIQNMIHKQMKANESEHEAKELDKEKSVVSKKTTREMDKLDIEAAELADDLSKVHSTMIGLGETASAYRTKLREIEEELDMYRWEAETLERGKRLTSLYKKEDKKGRKKTPRE